MSSLSVSLKSASAIYGGKAFGLAKVINAGFPVPTGIALHPDFVKSIVQDNIHESIDVSAISNLRHWLSPSKMYAVRSSVIGEDGIDYSYAGIYETVLNVSSNFRDISEAIRRVSQSQDSAQVRAYDNRSSNAVNIQKAPLGIIIQEMVDPLIAGVAFSSAVGIDGQDTLMIELVSGLADKLVAGLVTPARIEIPYDTDGNANLKRMVTIGTLPSMRGIVKLVNLINRLMKTTETALDIEWAIDKVGKPWLLQARPITRTVFVPPSNGKITAIPAAPGVGKGLTYVISSDKGLKSFPDKAVLVANVTEAHYLPAMKRASAIITEEGGILSHAAIVSREMGIPCVVGYSNACEIFKSGTFVTVDGTRGTVSLSETSTVDVNAQTSIVVDWGAAYLFDYLFPIKINKIQVYFDPTPTGLSVHIPDDIDIETNEKIELFSRQQFGQSPKRYKSDKYLWCTEWYRFRQNEYFLHALNTAREIVEQFNSKELTYFYNMTIENCKALVDLRAKQKNHATRFFIDELLLSSHFMLTMLIPEGYVVQSMFNQVISDLEENNLSFSELFVGGDDITGMPSSLQNASSFSRTISTLRNDIYHRLTENNIMRGDYFDDRSERAKCAVDSMSIKVKRNSDDLTIFYQNIQKVPDVHGIMDKIGFPWK